MGKVVKVKVLFFLLYLLWFTNGTRGYYTWNLDDQALSPPLVKIWNYLFIAGPIFFSYWLFLLLKPLTNPSEVRFLVYYKKFWEILDQSTLLWLIFQSKNQEILVFSLFFQTNYSFLTWNQFLSGVSFVLMYITCI